MGEPIRINFGTQSDPGRTGADAGPRHINAYVGVVVEGKHPAPVYASDGWTLFSTITNGGKCRGILDLGATLYVLSGTQLVFVDNTGTATLISGLAGTDPVIMARNAATLTQIAITSEGNKFVIQNNALSQITDTDLPPANSCTFLNKRIIFLINDGRFFWSAIDDATDISALNFAEAEGNPDGGVRIIAHEQELWIFGENTTEVWRDTGATTAPFRRNASAVIEKGCIAPHSVVEIDKDLVWLGDDGSVYRAQGYGFQRISHHGVEQDIEDTTDKSAITAFSDLSRGHHFYYLNGPDWSWAWNRTYNKWFERESHGQDRWRAECHAVFEGKRIVGDLSNGKLYELDPDAFDEAGEHLVWTLRSPPNHAWPNQICVDALHLDMTVGVGLNDADAHKSDPVVGVRWSDDGGKAWSNQLTRSLGKIGERNVEVSFWGLGMTGRIGRIWEIQCSSPVIRSLGYAAIEGEKVGT